jgi:hypothetical protein
MIAQTEEMTNTPLSGLLPSFPGLTPRSPPLGLDRRSEAFPES